MFRILSILIIICKTMTCDLCLVPAVFGGIISNNNYCNNINYYMANPVLGKSLCSDWFFVGHDFAVRTISMETVQSVYFCSGAKPANSEFATKTAKKKCENCHSSHWNYKQKLKRYFRNFKDGWRRRTFFNSKPPEVHFTFRNRVPYNKLLTNWACCTVLGPYCHDLRPIFPSTALALG